MIYVSTSGLKKDKIVDSVIELAQAGFKNIELSGGSNFYPEFEQNLLEAKEKFGLSYRCHNYFPPPKEHFVLNLASSLPSIVEATKNHIAEALRLSKVFGSKEYGLHAGYLIDPQVDELGRAIGKKTVLARDTGKANFEQGLREMTTLAEKNGVKIFVENNVISAQNYERFSGTNPLLLTEADEILDFKKTTPLNLLLDVAHLKVSCSTVGHNFANQLEKLLPYTSYLHISDNDGSEDTNESFNERSELYSLLHNFKPLLQGKTFTLEVYESVSRIDQSYRVLRSLLD